MTALAWHQEERTSFAHLWAVPCPDEFVVLEPDTYTARIEHVEEFRTGFFRVTWRILEGAYADRRAKTVWPFDTDAHLRALSARLERLGVNWRDMHDASDVRRVIEGLVVQVEMTEARNATGHSNRDMILSVLR